MSFTSEYLELRKKRKEKEEELLKTGDKFTDEYISLTPQTEDIAPVRQTTTTTEAPIKEEDERTWFQKGALKDGVSVGNIFKTIEGTARDLGENLTAGILGIGEAVVDAGAYVAGAAVGKVNEDFANKTKEFIAKDLYDEKEVAKKILDVTNPFSSLWAKEENSVLGDKSDSLVQSGGQLLATAGLQAVGVPWFLTTGVTSFGGEVENAFEQGATYGEAGLSAAISAGAEILTEKLSGGINFGAGTLDDVLTKKLVTGISNKVVRTLAKLGMDFVGEGAEEVISQVASNLGSSLYKEENLKDILLSEEAVDGYIESFIGGGVLGGGISGSKIASNYIKSITTNTPMKDATSGLMPNEEAVFKKVYDARIAEAQENGEKLSAKDKSKIYDEVMEDLEKGDISIDDIEGALGGETYANYKNTVNEEAEIQREYDELYKMKNGEKSDEQIDRQAELKKRLEEIKAADNRTQLKTKLSEDVFNLAKGTKLEESYNERARKGEAYTADVSKYDAKQKEIVQKAIDSGILNNSRRTHEFVDIIAKISADKGVSFDFTNNAKLKESGFAIDGKEVNGYVTKDGVTLNIDSHRAWQTTVGHEITHVLEGTELYTELQNAIKAYAETKGEYKSRYDKLTELYKDVDADIDAELTADLVGEYLFTDSEFVNNLSTKHRNVFQKIYDEIKYLLKVATAGSKEARQLEKVKRAFDKAYKTDSKAETDTVKYSLGEYSEHQKQNWVNSKRIVVYNNNEQLTQFIQDSVTDKTMDKKMYFGTITSDLANRIQTETGLNVEQYNLSLGSYEVRKILKDHGNEKTEAPRGQRAITSDDFSHIVDIVLNPTNIELSDSTYMGKPAIIFTGNYNGKMNVVAVVSDKRLDLFVQTIYVNAKKENLSTPIGEQAPINTPEANSGTVFSENIIPQNSKKSSGSAKFSLSSDSDGKTLTKEQSEYFKNSKMRDENGNLKVMYHGSQDAGFHIFDSNFSDDGTSFFFVDRNEVAATYSGTSETYEAQTIRTAEDMNKFIKSIGVEGYEVVERNGKFDLIYEGDRVATSDTPQGIYEEFTWYEGIGEGNANYKVYLNLTNPLVVDAEGRNWNDVSREYSQEVADRYNSLTAEEKAALTDLAEWGQYGIFRDELLSVAKAVADGKLHDSYADLASAYKKLGGANANLYDAFTIAEDNFSEESIKQFAVKQMKTRDYAQRAKEQGYDGVIFKNIHDNGGYSNGSEGASTVAIAFNSEQIKSVANAQPTGNKDIRYSLSEDSEGRKLSDNQKKYFNGSKVVDDNGNLKVVYHGSPADFNTFSLKYLGTNGTNEGYGFYFTDSKRIAEGYSKGREGQQNGPAGRLFEVYLDIKKPLSDTEVTMSRAQFKKLLIELNKQVDADGEPLEFLSNYGDVSWEGLNKVLNYAMEIEYDGSDSDVNMVHSIINACGDKELVFDLLRKVTGYDGIIVNEATWGGDQTIYIAFHPEQIKNVDNLNPTADHDIRRSLSSESEAPIRDRGRTPLRDMRLETTEDIAPTQDTTQDSTQDSTQVEPATETDDYPDGFAPITEEEANAISEENLASLTDEDAPAEDIAPYYGEDTESIDPFEDRDMKEVSKDRKVNAYQYDNPEVKPFFQEEANILLGELQQTQKPETIYNGWNKYNMTYEAAQDIPDIYRTPRMATESIEYLRDTVEMSYADIEKGLNAIIKDEGAENIAAAKKLEFHINDRLIHGYTVDGMSIPPNQDYINLLETKHNEEKGAQITKQGEESFAHLMDDLAPTKKTPDLFETSGSGQMSMFEQPKTEKPKPAKAYEAIRPEKPSAEPTPEPRMKRADSTNLAPDGMEERSWYETSTSSKAVDGIVTPDEIPDEVRYYKVKANKDTLATANARLERDGYAKSREYFEGRMSEKKLTVEDIALGERLIQEAAKAGDAKAVRDLIIDVSILGTELGQRVQALSMIRRLTPEGQLRALTRTIERGKAKGDPAFKGVEVTEEMSETLTSVYNKDGTFDQADLNAAVEDVKQQIADQMEVTKLDKVNAWRYLAMLGNPKTHIRNIVSNVAMFGTRTVKNVVARTVEDVALRNRKIELNTEDIAPIASDADAANRAKDNGQIGMFKPANPTRTKTWKRATDAVKAFAIQTAIEEKANIQGDSKYSDEGSIKSKRRMFNNKALNAVDTFNKNAMEAEDWFFSNNTYRFTLQEYLTANGVKTEADIKNNPELISKAKEYALEEAQRATFRQDSYFANKIAEIERKNPGYGAVIGSIMPFKRTPINIAKTGLGYSPLGIARNIYDAVQVKKGNMDASEAIDHVAQTLTGTSLALLGFILADFGFLNGAGDDDKEGKYDYQLGKQSYSVTVGGNTYSLSWLSPVAMPLFVGVNAYETLVDQKEWDANVVFDTLGQTLDPLSEMSFLSSLDDVLTSYDSGADRIFGAAESMIQNYATQFIPTLSSQIASTFDDTKRSTKASKDSGFAFGEETVNKLMYKIPGLRNTLEPMTDIWGNEAKQNENILARGFESFFSPANKREGIYTAVDEEIKELYRDTDDVGVIPSIPYNYINYDGEKYEMSAKEHTEYKKLYGQTAYDLMADLFETNTYKNATSEEKADMVNRVYDYARDVAKRDYFGSYAVEYTNATKDGKEYYKENSIKGAIEADMPVDEYDFSKEYPEKYKFFKANGISYEIYKAADEDGKRAYTWAYENPGKYTLSKAVSDEFLEYYSLRSTMNDFDAKDANGNSVSGLKKERVIEYINGLNLDYGQKILLYRSMYDSKEDRNNYNADIVEYLNNREDISYMDMVVILKELGFTVHSDGRVTW